MSWTNHRVQRSVGPRTLDLRFRPSSKRRGLRPSLIGALCVAMAALTVAPAVASASPTQSVGDLQAQAKQVAQQLSALQTKTDTLDEQYLEAQNEAADLKAKLAAKQAAVAQAKSGMADNQKAARDYAVEAYVGGGDVDP